MSNIFVLISKQSSVLSTMKFFSVVFSTFFAGFLLESGLCDPQKPTMISQSNYAPEQAEYKPQQEEYKQVKPYNFGYNIDDGYGTQQWREEKSDPESNAVTGTYGYRDRQGIYREVQYIADKNGFRVRMKSTEPGMASQNPANVEIHADPIVLPEEPKQKSQYQNHQQKSQSYSQSQSKVQQVPQQQLSYAPSKPVQQEDLSDYVQNIVYNSAGQNANNVNTNQVNTNVNKNNDKMSMYSA